MSEFIKREDALKPSEILTVHTREYGDIDVVPVDAISSIPAADVPR